MLARSDDTTTPWRDPEPLDRSWRGMAWALVLSVALHLGIAGPLYHLLSQATWEPMGPVLSIELSKSERVASAEDHESESEKPQPHAPARPLPAPSPRPVPITPRVRQRAEQRIPDSKSPAAPAPAQARTVETPVAAVSRSSPATRAVEQASSSSTASESSRHEPGFHLVYAPQPSYPRLARQLGLEGRVVLGIWVSANGVPDVIVVKESSGYDSLDVSAREGVRKWRFENRDGASAGGWVTQPVTFRLE